MGQDIHLSCFCGKVKCVLRDVTPRDASRQVCCCSGCQRYARALGCAEKVLDDGGGTHVFQVSPARLELLEGHEEHLAVLKQTPKGAWRWYASCCHAPLFNSLPILSFAFLGVLEVSVDQAALPAPLETYVGPVRATVNGHFTGAEKKRRKATVGALLKLILRLLPMTFLRWRGDMQRSPLYDIDKGAFIRTPSSELIAASNPVDT